MQITPSAMSAMYFNFLARYQAGFEATPNWTPRVATEVPSSTRENRYPWVKELSGMKEWIGERQVDNLAARVYSILNKSWEKTVELDKEDVEDDNFGTFAMFLDQLSHQAKKWPDDVMQTVIQSGAMTVCYDGQYFFDTDHPVDMDNSGLGTYVNNFTSRALNPTNYDYVRVQMQQINGADGRPYKVNPSLLVVPPALETVGRQILQGDTITTVYGSNTAAAASTNIWKGSADLLVVPELANEPTVWYLFDVTKPIKPFVWQLRKAPVFTALASPTDENVFWRRKFVYGVDSRGNGGFTLPFLAARAIA